MDPTTKARLGNSLLKNLIGLREKKGQIHIEDVGSILDGMASSIVGEDASHKFLREEIERMAKDIGDARTEIMEMIPKPEDEAPKSIVAASLELDEVVKATEEATGQIMDNADIISDVASKVSDQDLSLTLMNASSKIYDACSFQDITGQRIKKSMTTLANIEARVHVLMQLFGVEAPEGYVAPNLDTIERPDEELMSGPQMSGDAPSQEDIDKLFESI